MLTVSLCAKQCPSKLLISSQHGVTALVSRRGKSAMNVTLNGGFRNIIHSHQNIVYAKYFDRISVIVNNYTSVSLFLDGPCFDIHDLGESLLIRLTRQVSLLWFLSLLRRQTLVGICITPSPFLSNCKLCWQHE
jgi:hypothetical protein